LRLKIKIIIDRSLIIVQLLLVLIKLKGKIYFGLRKIVLNLVSYEIILIILLKALILLTNIALIISLHKN
jgi:hypothetical protein